jgi:hypothetical protein
MITATACAVCMGSEAKRLKIPGFGWHFVAIFLVGMCFALPTFLYRRQAILERLAKSDTEAQQ